VDGCFWHGCGEHGTQPKANASWWREKIRANQLRDRDTDERLRDIGWLSARVWEHEDIDTAADRIAEIVKRRLPEGRSSRLNRGDQSVEAGGLEGVFADHSPRRAP